MRAPMDQVVETTDRWMLMIADNMLGDLVAIVMALAVAFLLSAVGDLIRNQSQRRFEQLMVAQRFFTRHDGSYYIPQSLIDEHSHPQPAMPRPVGTTRQDDGTLSESEIMLIPATRLQRMAPTWLAILGIAIGLVLVVLDHG